MGRERCWIGKAAMRGCASLAATVLAACVATGPETPPIAAAQPVPVDPVAAFAANATPGQEASLVLTSGERTRARLHRAYPAASGRECREVLLGDGPGQRPQLVCQDPEQGWVLARTLLRGGARP